MYRTHTDPVAEFRSVEKSFETRSGLQLVLKNIDLIVRAGEMVALLGPSGSGKSTLLALAGLLQKPTAGSVIVGGHSTEELSEAERTKLRASHIGFLFQEPTLTAHLTALENVLLPLLADRHSARPRAGAKLLAQMGLAEHSGKLPGALSGGQAQRVALCRALVRSPRLLLADEPTASLDAAAAQNVRQQLRSAAQNGVGILVATHDLATAEHADRVVALDQGTIDPANFSQPRPTSRRHAD